MTPRIDRSVVDQDIQELLEIELPWSALFGSSILVTGASGMIPSYVVRLLLALNDNFHADITVRGLVRNGPKARSLLGAILDRKDFQLIEEDVSTFYALDGPVDIIVHGASAARPQLHSSDPVATLRANLLGTFNLLDLSLAKRSEKFVLMSSSEIYGDQDATSDLISENSYGGFDILHPRACYAEGKRGAESILSAYAHQYRTDSKILRFGHIYGPGMALDDGRVQADFAADVIKGNNICLNSDGSAVRTYTYVADAVSGLFHALFFGDERAYNVADPNGLITIKDLALRFTGARPLKNLELVFSNPVDASTSIYSSNRSLGLDSSRLTALGWSPRVSLDLGIDRMLRSLEETLESS